MASHRLRDTQVGSRCRIIVRRTLILDTSFLIRLLRGPLRLSLNDVGLDEFEMTVPDLIIEELKRLGSRAGGRKAVLALKYAESLPKVRLPDPSSVDDGIVAYAVEHGAAVATLDAKLKKRLRRKGVAVLGVRAEKPFFEGRFTEPKTS